MARAGMALLEREEISRGLVEDGQFQRSLHGEGSVERCWALVVE